VTEVLDGVMDITTNIVDILLKFFDKLAKTKLLILDDFGLSHHDKQQQLDLMDIVEDRHGRSSVIIANQLPITDCYNIFGDRGITDAILYRLVHTSYRIELDGYTL